MKLQEEVRKQKEAEAINTDLSVHVPSPYSYAMPQEQDEASGKSSSKEDSDQKSAMESVGTTPIPSNTIRNTFAKVWEYKFNEATTTPPLAQSPGQHTPYSGKTSKKNIDVYATTQMETSEEETKDGSRRDNESMIDEVDMIDQVHMYVSGMFSTRLEDVKSKTPEQPQDHTNSTHLNSVPRD